jgi:hypothetical protein
MEWMPVFAIALRDCGQSDAFNERGMYVADKSGDDFCDFLHEAGKSVCDGLTEYKLIDEMSAFFPEEGKVAVRNGLYGKALHAFGVWKQPSKPRGVMSWSILEFGSPIIRPGTAK